MPPRSAAALPRPLSRSSPEETGIEVPLSELIPVRLPLEAEAHTIRYPNGDLTHCFCVLLPRQSSGSGDATARRGRRRPRSQFADLDDLPDAMDPPARHALTLLKTFLLNGEFQVH